MNLTIIVVIVVTAMSIFFGAIDALMTEALKVDIDTLSMNDLEKDTLVTENEKDVETPEQEAAPEELEKPVALGQLDITMGDMETDLPSAEELPAADEPPRPADVEPVDVEAVADEQEIPWGDMDLRFRTKWIPKALPLPRNSPRKPPKER